MTTEEIYAQVEIAEGVANKIAGTELRVAAFEIVLTYLLSGRTVQPTSVFTSGNQPLARIVDWVGCKPDEIMQVFDLREDGVRIVLPREKIPYRQAAGVQRFLALLKLGADRIGYGVDDTSSQTITDICRDFGCQNKNISQNLTACYAFFETRPGNRGLMKMYRIRREGIDQARKELRHVLGI